MKVCATPGCPNIQAESKCADCRSKAERARGTRQARGYDANHDAERKRWSPIVATGGVKCWRCLAVLNPDEPWDLGHDDLDRSTYRGPECLRCNRATASPRTR